MGRKPTKKSTPAMRKYWREQYQKRKKKALSILILLVMCLSPLSPFLAIVPVSANEVPWLDGWNYRKTHAIVGSTTASQTDYVVAIKGYYGDGTDGNETINGLQHGKIYLNETCEADFGDIRFTEDDGTTELDYWMQEYVNASYAIFWIELNDIPQSPDTETIYIYYGLSDLSTTSNGTATFLEFQDFGPGPYIDPAEAPPWDCVAEKDDDNPIFSGNYSAISDIDIGKLGDTFYAIFPDQVIPDTWDIYIASSPNLKDWTLENDGDPILSHEGTGWEEERNAYCGMLKDIDGNIIQHDGVYWIIYAGAGNGTEYNLGRANATTITGPWTKDENNPLDLFTGENRYSAPVLFKEDSTFYMYYSYKEGLEVGNLFAHLANSTDLETWINSENNPIVSPTPGWYSERIFAEDIVKMVVGETTYYYLLMNGYNGANYQAGILRATEIDTDTWIDEGNNPLLSPVAATWEADLIDHGTIVSYNDRWNIVYTGVVLGVTGKLGIAYLREEPNLDDWVYNEEDVSISNGELKVINEDYITLESTNYSNIAVEVKIKLISAIRPALIARYDGAGFTDRSDYHVYLRDVPADEIRITETVDGSGSTLDTEIWNIDEDEWHLVSFRLYGSTLKQFIRDAAGNEVTGSADDETLASGYVGVRTFGDGGDNRFDDFRVRKYVDPEPTHGDWGEEESPGPPTVTTQDASDIVWLDGTYSATLHGNITSTGGQDCDNRGFEWGTSTGNYTVGWNERDSFGTGSFNRTYAFTGTVYYRAYAENSAGYGYGAEKSFTHPANVTLTITDMDDTDNLYSMRKYYTWIAEVNDPEGATNIDEVRLRGMDSATPLFEVMASNLTGTPTFSIVSNDTIIDLDTGACSWGEAGDIGTATFKIRTEWDHPQVDDGEISVYVEDSVGNSSGWQERASNYFDIINRLVTTGFGSNTSSAEVDSPIQIFGSVRYATTTDGNLASSSYPPHEEFTSVEIRNDQEEIDAVDTTITNGSFNVTFNSNPIIRTTYYYVWLDLLDDYIDGPAPDGDLVFVTTTSGFYLSWLIDNAFSFFGIIDYITQITAYGSELGAYFASSITNLLLLITQQFRVVLGIFGFFVDWYTRMVSLFIAIGTAITGLLDGTGDITTGLGNIWDFIAFGTWIDIVPVIFFIWWVESIATRGETQGEISVFLGDMQTVMNVTSWFLSMFSLVINTMTDLAFRLMEVIT